MKRYLLCLAAICGSAVGTTEESNTYEGLFAGGGVSYIYTSSKITESDYWGKDISAVIPGHNWVEICKPKSGMFAGALVVGYGVFCLGKCGYIGVEAMFDIAANSKHHYELADNRFPDDSLVAKIDTKTEGFVPMFAGRLGWRCAQIDTLFYMRVGGAYIQNKAKVEVCIDNGGGDKSSFTVDLDSKKLVPFVGVGVEKNVYDRWNVRVEGDIQFSRSKEKNGDLGPGVGDAWMKFKSKSSSYTFRLLGVYVF